MAELNPGQISFNEWIAKNIAEKKQKNDRKGWLDYFLNPFTKPGLGDAGGPTVLGESDYADTMIRGQTDKSIESPDAITGVKNAATEARILADQNKEGLGPNYGAHGWHDFATPVESGMGVATPNMGYDYNDEGYADLSSPVAMPRPSEMGGQHADWSNPVTSTASPFPGSRYPGEIKDFDISTARWVGSPRVMDKRPTTRPSIPAFGMRRPETSFDANIEVGGRPGGWFTPEEYGRNYYKFGRGA